MTDAEAVDAAMIEHLSEQVVRLEAENEALKEAMKRPVQVMPPVTYTAQTPYQTSVLATLSTMGSSLMSIQSSMATLAAAANRAHP